MGFLELLLIGVGLSMDAFAVAVCQGLCMPKLNLRYAAVIALFFGGFQALMPYAGWLLGAQFAGLLLCKQAAKIFQTICKKETALKRVLRNLLSAISFAQI